MRWLKASGNLKGHTMRTRNRKIEFWANEDESAKLTRCAKVCKMTRSAYLRQLLNGYEPQAAPPYDYHQMIKELRAVGNNLNQIAHRAHAIGSIDAADYAANSKVLTILSDNLARTFLPQKRGE
jgi:hypothetical protein